MTIMLACRPACSRPMLSCAMLSCALPAVQLLTFCESSPFEYMAGCTGMCSTTCCISRSPEDAPLEELAAACCAGPRLVSASALHMGVSSSACNDMHNSLCRNEALIAGWAKAPVRTSRSGLSASNDTWERRAANAPPGTKALSKVRSQLMVR